jgi:anti-sigma factor RsiW
MTDHLSPASLNSFVDGELSAEQVASATEHLAGCPSCAAALLLLSASIAVIERNVRRTTIASGKPDALGTGVCDPSGLASAPAADSELAARLRLSIQLARWGLLSTVSEVKA